MSCLDIVTNPAAMADMLSNMRVLPGVQANDNDGRLIIQGGSPEESKDSNNQLNTGTFGIPTEKYGFSNNARGKMGPPAFKDCMIKVEEEDTVIYITLM